VIIAISHIDYFIYLHVCYLKILHSAHAVYLCILFGPENKQLVYPYRAISGRYLQNITRDYRTVNRNVYTNQCSPISKWVGPWLRQLELDFLPRRLPFDWRSVHQGIVVENVSRRPGFLLFLWFHSRHGSDEWQLNSHYVVSIQVSISGVCAATKTSLYPRNSVLL